MIRAAAFLGLLGLAAATGLVLYQGFGAVAHALSIAGFGLIWASLWHFVSMSINGAAWRALLPGAKKPSLVGITWTVWVRESVNALLPVAKIGGEIASVQVLRDLGLRTAPAVASIVVDTTLTIVSQFCFTLIGLALLAGYGGSASLIRSAAIGAALAVPIVVAFLAVQRYGLFTLLGRVMTLLFGDRLAAFLGHAGALDKAVRLFYRRRGRIFACTVLQLVGWTVASGELYLACLFLGHPISVADAVLIESLVQAASTAGFVVPAALGIQEGVFLVLGGIVGLAPETALALALARRVRDVVIFGPGLILWQVRAGRSLFRSRRVPGPAAPAG